MIMASNLQLELKSLGKSEKKTPTGVQQTTYNCVLKGAYGSITASLTLKSDNLKELDEVVAQKMDNQIIISIESIFKDGRVPG